MLLASKLCYWLVNQMEISDDNKCIHILDIFGFEVFEENSFEQICINYCNETLQGMFTGHVIELEVADCVSQGVPTCDCDFPSNKACVAMLEGKPDGLFSLLEDECKSKGGTDLAFVHKLLQHHATGRNAALMHPAMHSQTSAEVELSFRVRHYADVVTYSAAQFRHKNVDKVPADLMIVLAGSQNAFVKKLMMDGDGESSLHPSHHHAHKHTISSIFRKCVYICVNFRKCS